MIVSYQRVEARTASARFSRVTHLQLFEPVTELLVSQPRPLATYGVVLD